MSIQIGANSPLVEVLRGGDPWAEVDHLRAIERVNISPGGDDSEPYWIVLKSTNGHYSSTTTADKDLVDEALILGALLNQQIGRDPSSGSRRSTITDLYGLDTPMHNTMTADDLGFGTIDESDLESDTIKAGGLNLDTDDEGGETERFLFSRVPGSEDDADQYMSRAGIDHPSDVETIAAWLDAPRHIVGGVLLLGEPGTGKTAALEAAVTYLDRPLTTVVCTPDHTKDSLFLRFVGEGKGDDGTPFVLGPIPYAAKHGHVLYMDEVMLLMDGVKPILYALADGRRHLPEGNIDGSPLEIHPDFRLVMSANPQVRGASLPEPLASRCAGTTLTIETDAALLEDLGIHEDIIATWNLLGTLGVFRPQIRELRAAHYWLVDAPVPSPSMAASAFIPEHCPESDRQMVYDTVIGQLGGDLRADGRLVVK